ncbi:ABC transporter permease [Micromonosporaceae bacterium Da 78-11]
MIWLTWRQFRSQAWTAGALLATLAVLFLVTRPLLTGLPAHTLPVDCGVGCAGPAAVLLTRTSPGVVQPVYWGGLVLTFLTPALIGAFWGAPLVARELETGTQRLVWNQSVSRGRWLAAKLGVVGLGAVLAAGLLSLLVTWWSGPLDRVAGSRLLPDVFGARGIVPIGYAALAFVIGVTAGAVLRRTVPAMAVTLVLIAAVQAAAPFVLRPHLTEPVRYTVALDVDALRSVHLGGARVTVWGRVDRPGAWVLANTTVTPDGREYAGPSSACSLPSVESGSGPLTEAGSPPGCGESLAGQQLRQRVAYVPADRFWILQWRELVILLVASALLAIFGGWWIRRRLG